MVKRVILIHGWHGTPDENWFPWLKKQLEKRNVQVIVPQMPGKDWPLKEEWVAKIKEVVGKPDDETYFVGHSLACISILRYLEELDYKANIGGAVFVAGFAKSIGKEELMNFLKPEVNFENVLVHCGNFVCIFSDNDRYVPLEISHDLQKNLEAKTILEPGNGHFGSKENMKELPAVLEELIEMMG
ncbi:MAG: alpha/beta hydrolase [Nanoarchaeota archaeon]